MIDAALVAMPSRETERLWSLLAGTHFTLLLLAGAGATMDTYRDLVRAHDEVTQRGLTDIRVHVVAVEPPPEGALRPGIALHLDRTLQVHRRYGDGVAGIYLVRPDRYIGLRARSDDARALGAYLDRIFVTRAAR